MKKIIFILFVLLSANMAYAKNSAPDDRMQRYATLYSLFDDCISPVGIRDINYLEAVYQFWDFEFFADLVLQEISKSLEILPKNCIIDNSSRTLIIPLTNAKLMDYPIPVANLKLSFESDNNDDNRQLVVAYQLKDSSKSLDELEQQCLDLLEDTFKEISDNGQEIYEGEFDHLYTIDKRPEENSLWFSCLMPIPPMTWYSVSAGYAPQISYNKLPKSAPCNKGKESFSDFLKKFNSDTKFRVDRRNFSNKANHADYEDGNPMPTQFGFNEFVLEALDNSGLLPLQGHHNYKEYKSKSDPEFDEYTESCGQWFYPTENSVIYSGWDSSSEFPEQDCNIVILFERIDDEWNTTATWTGGKRFEDLIIQKIREKTSKF